MAGPDAPWRDAAAQVVVEDLDEPVARPDDWHHLSRVLRLRAGQTVCATDGRGGWRPVVLGDTAALDPAGEIRREPAPRYEVTVAFALVKGDKPELVVQKLTELGVDRIVAFSAGRSVVRWDETKVARNLERMRRVAREACGQCRRLWLPTVEVCDLASLDGPDVVCADVDGEPLGPEDRTVLIGPEGGWADGEVGQRRTASLGTNVLRAETAAIAAGTLLTALRAGLAAPGR